MKRIFKVIVNIVVVILVVFAGMIAFSAISGQKFVKVYSVQSGSMEPTIKVGSLIFVKPQNDYLMDDVVTVKMPKTKKL